MKTRGFEVISKYTGKGIKIPDRKTGASAGYDLAAAEDVVLQPGQVTLVMTGLKAYMKQDEYLGLYVRSSFSIKNNVSCINSVGVIDADYYNSGETEGHIMVPLINHGSKPVEVTKGTRVAQGIFMKYLTVDGDAPGEGNKRVGGIGSTGK